MKPQRAGRLLLLIVGCVSGPTPSSSAPATSPPTEAETARIRQRDAYAAMVRALDFEKTGEWAKARIEFDEALLRDAENPDAKAGKARVSKLVVAQLQFHKYIEASAKAAARGGFQLGVKRFNEALAVKPATVPLDEQTTQLREFLSLQNYPVEVTLESDGRTWVTIAHYRAGKKLEREVIKMIPGDYDFIGRRAGFETVVSRVQVRAGQPAPVVKVECRTQTTSALVKADEKAERDAELRAFQQALAFSRAEYAKADAFFKEEIENIRKAYGVDASPVADLKGKK